MLENPEFLLDRMKAQRFFNEKDREIFSADQPIKILDIKRSYTYNPDSYNILFKIEMKGKENFIRVATSKISSKELEYKTLQYFYSCLSGQSEFKVPRPLSFLAKENLMIYEDAQGEFLTHFIEQDTESLKSKFQEAAKLLVIIHNLPQPGFESQDPNLLFEKFNNEGIASRYKNLANNLNIILAELKHRIIKNQTSVYCHGDFNPNNLIYQESTISLIDFGSTCIFNPELDLASFITHLRIILTKKKHFENFETLKNVFLQTYNSQNSYNQEHFNLFMAVIDLRLLEIAILYKWFDHNEEHIPIIYQYLKDDLRKISIELND